jgi:hypothetical protein
MRGFLGNGGLAIGNNLIQCSTEPRAAAVGDSLQPDRRCHRAALRIRSRYREAV